MRYRRPRAVKHRWRDFRTASGRRPVREFIAERSDDDAQEIAAAMRDVREEGLRVARHLRGDIYEVRANGVDESYRLLFSQEGRKGRILLLLLALSKKTQRTPDADLRLAERRLADWRRRGASRRRR